MLLLRLIPGTTVLLFSSRRKKSGKKARNYDSKKIAYLQQKKDEFQIKEKNA